jgi:hypothetical protein
MGSERLAWHPREWAEAAGVGKTTTFALIKSGAIEAKKFGKSTLILTSPANFLASLPDAKDNPYERLSSPVKFKRSNRNG